MKAGNDFTLAEDSRHRNIQKDEWMAVLSRKDFIKVHYLDHIAAPRLTLSALRLENDDESCYSETDASWSKLPFIHRSLGLGDCCLPAIISLCDVKR